MAIEKLKEWHTFCFKSSMLEDIVKELNRDNFKVTRLVITASRTLSLKSSMYPIPELEKYSKAKLVQRLRVEMGRFKRLPLEIEERTEDIIASRTLQSDQGIDLKELHGILTSPPYQFPRVHIIEMEGDILTELPKGTPKHIKFKRTSFLPNEIKKEAKRKNTRGIKTVLDLKTTTQKHHVEAIRQALSPKDPIRHCTIEQRIQEVLACRITT